MVLSQLLRRFPRWNASYRGYREFKQMQRSPIKTPSGFWFSGNKLMQSGAGYQAITANRESRRIHLQEVQQVVATGIDTLQTHNFVFRFAVQE